jgi:hypothetical protein
MLERGPVIDVCINFIHSCSVGDSRGRTQSFIALKKNDENEKEGTPS